MIRRFLCACVAAALVGALALPAHIAAKPPDLPENGTFTVTPVVSPPALFFRFSKLNDHARTGISDDVLKDVPCETDEEMFISSGGRGRRSPCEGDQDWWKWLISHWTVRQQPPPQEQNDGYIRPIIAGTDFVLQVMSDEPGSAKKTAFPAVEVLPMPQEVADVTCPYLRHKMIDRQTCQVADPTMGRDVIENLKRLKRADRLLNQARALADAGSIYEALECCSRAAKLCPGSPCAKRAADTMFDLALGYIASEDANEEASEPQPESEIGSEKTPPPINYEIEMGTNADGGLRMWADCSLGTNVYHLRFKNGCVSIWRTPDGGKTMP